MKHKKPDDLDGALRKLHQWGLTASEITPREFVMMSLQFSGAELRGMRDSEYVPLAQLAVEEIDRRAAKRRNLRVNLRER